MKKLITFFSFTLFSIILVCSCTKNTSPQDLLVGTWKLTKTEIMYEMGSTSKSTTITPDTDSFMVFENNGTGRTFSIDNNRNFTYVFNDVISNLILTYGSGTGTSFIVEVLTETSLVIRCSENATILGVTVSSTNQSYYTRVK